MTHDSNDNPGLPLLPPTYPVMFLVGAVVLEFVLPLRILWAPALLSVPSLVAVLLVAGGVALDIWSMRVFKAAGTHVEPILPTLRIVKHGPYRLSRNPIYGGFLLVFAGLSVGFALEWGIIALPLLWLTLDRVVVQREEAYLTRKFSAEYETYLGRTRRWI